MLIINKEASSTRFVVSALQNVEPKTLVLYSAYTKKTNTFNLPGNTSAHPSRFDEFVMNNDAFQDLDEGLYKYTIKTADADLKSGVLKVMTNTVLADQYTVAAPDATDDDFIVYPAD